MVSCALLKLRFALILPQNATRSCSWSLVEVCQVAGREDSCKMICSNLCNFAAKPQNKALVLDSRNSSKVQSLVGWGSYFDRRSLTGLNQTQALLSAFREEEEEEGSLFTIEIAEEDHPRRSCANSPLSSGRTVSPITIEWC